MAVSLRSLPSGESLPGPWGQHPGRGRYRWRYEIAAALLVPLALVELDRAIGRVWLAVLLADVDSMVWHWRAARRFVLGRLRAVLVQHRLRTAFARVRVCTPDSRATAIV